jgi:hypothetical protein
MHVAGDTRHQDELAGREPDVPRVSALVVAGSVQRLVGSRVVGRRRWCAAGHKGGFRTWLWPGYLWEEKRADGSCVHSAHNYAVLRAQCEGCGGYVPSQSYL